MIHKLLLTSVLACLSAGAFAVCNVAPPTVDGSTQCASSMDINPATGKPNFPSSTLEYSLSAETNTSANIIVWYLDRELTKKYAEGSIISVPEDDPAINLQPGKESYLYAVSIQIIGPVTCCSEPVKAVIMPKLTPSKPKATYGYYEGKLIIFSEDDFAIKKSSPSGQFTLFEYENYQMSVNLGESPMPLGTLNKDYGWNYCSVYLGPMNTKFVISEEYSGCMSDTMVFEPIVFPSFKIDQVLSPNDVAYETVYIEQLKLKSLLIEAELLKQLLETTMPTIINDSLVVWYYKSANVLKADASWTVAGYGPNFVPQQYGTYMAEIHNTKGELVAVTKQYTVALGTPVAELAPAKLAITYSAGEISLNQPSHIAVYSSAGSCVAQGTGTSLTLSQLPAGVYIAKASTASASAELVITVQ